MRRLFCFFTFILIEEANIAQNKLLTLAKGKYSDGTALHLQVLLRD